MNLSQGVTSSGPELKSLGCESLLSLALILTFSGLDTSISVPDYFGIH